MAEENWGDLAYWTLDVFTQAPYSGNPLALVWEADHLSTQAMQSIAAEFGYSETVFVCASSQPNVDAKLRIFTPTFEMDFAGHPTIGAAIAFAQRQGLGLTDKLVFEERAGLVPVDFYEGEGTLHARLSPPQQPSLMDVPTPGLEGALLFEGEAMVAAASAGTPFLFLRLETPDAVDACAIAGEFAKTLAASECAGAFIYAQVGGNAFYARMFAPEFGVEEDPATGSAVAALSAALWDAGFSAGLYTIHQGVKMGRASQLYLEMDAGSNGALGAVRVSGAAALMMQGRLRG